MHDFVIDNRVLALQREIAEFQALATMAAAVYPETYYPFMLPEAEFEAVAHDPCPVSKDEGLGSSEDKCRALSEWRDRYNRWAIPRARVAAARAILKEVHETRGGGNGTS